MKMNYSLRIPSQEPLSMKIQAIRLVRVVTGMGLKDAKDLVEAGDVEVIGKRTLSTLESEERSLAMIASDLERTIKILEEKDVHFRLSLSISVEIGTGLVEQGSTGSIFQCPKCDQGVDDMIHADRNHLGLCHKCRIIFWAGSNMFSETGAKEEQEVSFHHWLDEKGYRIYDEKTEIATKPSFDRNKFYMWRNRLSLDAIQGKHTIVEFSSGSVTIEGTSHQDGGISWVCRFSDGGPEFRGSQESTQHSAIKELEDLLVQAGVIWWG